MGIAGGLASQDANGGTCCNSKPSATGSAGLRKGSCAQPSAEDRVAGCEVVVLVMTLPALPVRRRWSEPRGTLIRT